MAAVPTPLTTTFSPSPSCLTDIHWGTSSSWYVLGEYNTACIPHGSGSTLANPTLSSYYSPALYCPSGFTVACSSEVTSGTNTETRAYCCPYLSDVPLFSQTQFVCATDPPLFGAFSSYGCSFRWETLISQGPFTAVVTDAQGTRTTTTSETDTNGGINAYSVQIRWHASDLSLTATSSSTTASSTSAAVGTGSGSSTESGSTTSSSASATSPAASTSAASSSSSSGLSTGAKAAIGVVIPVVVILALLGGFFLLRKRKQVNNTQAPVESHQAMSNPRHEADGTQLPSYHEKPTPQHTYPHEMMDTSGQALRSENASSPMTSNGATGHNTYSYRR